MMDGDSALVALADEIMRTQAEILRLEDEIEVAGPAGSERQRKLEVRLRPLVERDIALRTRLAKMRATTPAGFRAKALVVRAYTECAERCADPSDQEALAWSLANDLLGIASVWRDEEPCLARSEALLAASA